MPKYNQKIIVYSLDYDGCTDILSDELYAKYKDNNEITSALSLLRNKLNAFFDKNEEISKDVEVYVGSNRQSKYLDKKNTDCSGNGSCFTTFDRLCTQRNWMFRPLLLADVHNNQPSGSSWQDENLHCGYFEPCKTDILYHQLRDTEKNHPNNEIHFYFMDDDAHHEILPGLKKFCTARSKDLSRNIHIHLIKFDWYGEIAEHNQTLFETFSIQGKKDQRNQSRHSFFAKGKKWLSDVKDKISHGVKVGASLK